MKNEIRTAVYDEELRIEAYRFEGIIQPFPNHFHEYYVLGAVESGERCLSCRSRRYYISMGDVLLFNPGDNHACIQTDDNTFNYRGINIPKEVMLDLSEEVTGNKTLPGFTQNVIHDEEAAACLNELHELIMKGSREFSREEDLLLLITLLIRRYGNAFESCIPECRSEIEKACKFIAQHFAERLSLQQICCHVGLSKSTLLRSFTRSKGVTPYSYLENIRISEAKKLLEQGIPPVEAAMRTGFSDQSHFTNYFNRFIGLSPGVYRDIFSEKTTLSKNAASLEKTASNEKKQKEKKQDDR